MSKPESESETESEADIETHPEQVEEVDLTQYEDDEDDYITLESLLGSTLMTPEGDTVCTALVNLGRQLEIQNKIMVKMLSLLQKENRA
ncbi:MAG: hypothetical protein CL881_08825 [Dehalococcoidia bacterium]|jgi:hypothetical protein|nr:hypothetical protein [Dehalococcoidia bacterium]|tara:strand:+ start:720 stop:986 length:267 start_codon:yes stop_codon:yes gene_type:complete